MLVTSNYKKNDIIGIKLSTGEEVVARFEKFDSATNQKTLYIIKPTVLTLNPESGQIMLIPWLMSIDVHSSDPVTVSQEQIVALYKPSKGISDVYMQGSSGIKIPSVTDTEKLTGLL
tara:strand:- start:4620 stop:4970 length:351 start_codon:yes stop_codon:yes gene_type:complete